MGRSERCGGGETIMHTERFIKKYFSLLNSCCKTKVTEHHSDIDSHTRNFSFPSVKHPALVSGCDS